MIDWGCTGIKGSAVNCGGVQVIVREERGN